MNNVNLQKLKTAEDKLYFRIFSYILCLFTIIGYGFFVYLSIFEIELIYKSILLAAFLTFGYIWSWYNRHSNQIFVKIILALIMVLVALGFFRSLPENTYDPRIPLLELLISLLVIHSFDLPGKKDILYSITSSLIVLIVLSTISTSSFMIPYIVVFIFLFFLALFVMDYENVNLKQIYRVNLFFTILVLFLGFLLFLFLPKPVVGNYFFRVVFAPKGYEDIESSYSNPKVYEKVYEKQLQNVFSKNYVYKNFKGEMNLENRGLLPHILIMKVKAPYITYIKGFHLVYYDGKKWYNKTESKEEFVKGDYSYFSLPSEFVYSSTASINTYFMIFEDLPDILYHVPIAGEVFFPASYIRVKDYNFYSEYPLVKGVTYTINSRIPYFDFNKLKSLSFDEYVSFFSRIYSKDPFYLDYLSLPLISKDIHTLANSLTKDESTFWGKVEAIKTYLESNYTYDLFISNPKDEAVYDFLFIQKRGYCEQFASSLAVMLRSIGIPSRVVLGYLPQKRDIFTGFVEVYADDAHAWVEVLTPFGWIPVDPTPANVDEYTLRYLENKSKDYFVSSGTISEEFAQSIRIILEISLRLFFLVIASFIIHRIYIWIKRKLIVKYLENVDINNLSVSKFKEVFINFVRYYEMKNVTIPQTATLREIKNLKIVDPFFDKFRRFLDVYERYLYGPKL